MIRRPPISTRTDTLSLHDALPISPGRRSVRRDRYPRLRAHHFEIDAGGEFLHAKAALAAIEDEAAIIGDDRIDHGGAGKRPENGKRRGGKECVSTCRSRWSA